jgi:hypothetical protein
MPPSKKNNLNSILQSKNFSNIINTDTTLSIKLDSKLDSNSTLDNIIENKIEQPIIKSLDTYFGIVTKPSSPILDIIQPQQEVLDQNTKLTLSEIKHRIDNLYENELIEIFKILRSNKEKYTTNNNGIFVNICTLKPITITEITQFLIYSEKTIVSEVFLKDYLKLIMITSFIVQLLLH